MAKLVVLNVGNLGPESLASTTLIILIPSRLGVQVFKQIKKKKVTTAE